MLLWLRLDHVLMVTSVLLLFAAYNRGTRHHADDLPPVNLYDRFCVRKYDGLYPDPLSCQQFIHCIRHRTSVRSCQWPLHFNRISKTCDFAERAQCKFRKKAFSQPKGRSLGRSRTHIENICFNKIYEVFRNPSNCFGYIICINGESIQNTCPPGLVFDEISSHCISGKNQKCNRVDPVCHEVENGYYPSQTNCNEFVHCFNGQSFQRACPSFLDFNSAEKRCDWPDKAQCDQRILSPTTLVPTNAKKKITRKEHRTTNKRLASIFSKSKHKKKNGLPIDAILPQVSLLYATAMKSVLRESTDGSRVTTTASGSRSQRYSSHSIEADNNDKSLRSIKPTNHLISTAVSLIEPSASVSISTHRDVYLINSVTASANNRNFLLESSLTSSSGEERRSVQEHTLISSKVQGEDTSSPFSITELKHRANNHWPPRKRPINGISKFASTQVYESSRLAEGKATTIPVYVLTIRKYVSMGLEAAPTFMEHSSRLDLIRDSRLPVSPSHVKSSSQTRNSFGITVLRITDSIPKPSRATLTLCSGGEESTGDGTREYITDGTDSSRLSSSHSLFGSYTPLMTTPKLEKNSLNQRVSRQSALMSGVFSKFNSKTDDSVVFNFETQEETSSRKNTPLKSLFSSSHTKTRNEDGEAARVHTSNMLHSVKNWLANSSDLEMTHKTRELFFKATINDFDSDENVTSESRRLPSHLNTLSPLHLMAKSIINQEDRESHVSHTKTKPFAFPITAGTSMGSTLLDPTPIFHTASSTSISQHILPLPSRVIPNTIDDTSIQPSHSEYRAPIQNLSNPSLLLISTGDQTKTNHVHPNRLFITTPSLDSSHASTPVQQFIASTSINSNKYTQSLLLTTSISLFASSNIASDNYSHEVTATPTTATTTTSRAFTKYIKSMTPRTLMNEKTEILTPHTIVTKNRISVSHPHREMISSTLSEIETHGYETAESLYGEIDSIIPLVASYPNVNASIVGSERLVDSHTIPSKNNANDFHGGVTSYQYFKRDVLITDYTRSVTRFYPFVHVVRPSFGGTVTADKGTSIASHRGFDISSAVENNSKETSTSNDLKYSTETTHISKSVRLSSNEDLKGETKAVVTRSAVEASLGHNRTSDARMLPLSDSAIPLLKSSRIEVFSNEITIANTVDPTLSINSYNNHRFLRTPMRYTTVLSQKSYEEKAEIITRHSDLFSESHSLENEAVMSSNIRATNSIAKRVIMKTSFDFVTEMEGTSSIVTPKLSIDYSVITRKRSTTSSTNYKVPLSETNSPKQHTLKGFENSENQTDLITKSMDSFDMQISALFLDKTNNDQTQDTTFPVKTKAVTFLPSIDNTQSLIELETDATRSSRIEQISKERSKVRNSGVLDHSKDHLATPSQRTESSKPFSINVSGTLSMVSSMLKISERFRRLENVCRSDYVPVCGSDEVTYWNDCFLAVASLNCETETFLIHKLYDGKCMN